MGDRQDRGEVPSASAEANFRVRVAREKRERMRARLLEATLDLFGAPPRGSSAPGPVVIDDVIRRAGVSRGSFYKYFDSIEDIVAALGRDMADEMVRSMELVLGELPDAAARAAAGPLMPLARAAMQPRWAAFTSRVDYVDFLTPSRAVGGIVAGELLRAREAGLLAFASVEAALDLLAGAVVEGTRRLAATTQTAAYIRELSAMILTGLGMKRQRADKAVAQAWLALHERQAALPWWRPLEE